MDIVGKETGQKSQGVPIASKTVPVVTINGRRFIATGRWNTSVVADFVLEEGMDWLAVGEVARFAHCTNTVPNRKKVRANLSKLFMEMMSRGFFLAIEYSGENGAASALKVADVKHERDKKLILHKIAKMRKSRELTQEQYDRSMVLFHQLVC